MKILLAITIVALSILSASGNTKQNIHSKQLMWQDAPLNALYKMSFKRALAYCDTLQYDKLTDWRLPNSNELISTVNTNRIPTIKSTFNYSSVGCYWSYTKGQIGSVNFQEATIRNNIKYIEQECFVRCVRDK
ncbi:MAG: DUF1566 domain-containing protein [Sulfurovaceae bacterium]|nr:DUF1566 domain-containing protein [Sulfurovaceae bacterium]